MENGNDDSTYAELLGDILGDFVGQGKQFTVEQFARDAGVSRQVIYRLQAHDYTPSFEFAMKIVRALPEEGAERFFAGLGFTGLRRISGPRVCFRRAHEIIAGASQKLAEYFVDGRIDHREEAEWNRTHRPRLTAAISSMENDR